MAEFNPGSGWWKASDGEWYPPRWEYRTLQGSRTFKGGKEALDGELADLGASGWEAVGITGDPVSTVLVLMRRPIRP